MRWCLLLLLLLLAVPLSVSGKTEANDQILVRYDNRFNEGNDLKLSIQILFNMSYLEVTIYTENDSFPAFVGEYDSWYFGDWVEVTVSAQYLTAGEYRGRIVAKPQNRTYAASTLFFDFAVNRVLDDAGITIASGMILIFAITPFLYYRDKKSLEKYEWNIIDFRKYLRKRLLSKAAYVSYILIVVIGGAILYVR